MSKTNLVDIIKKCDKKFREYVLSRPYRACTFNDDVVILSCNITKPIYSYKANPPIIQIREDIYNSDCLPLVEEKAYISLNKFTEVTNKAKEEGKPYHRMNSTHKKIAEDYAKQVLIEKYGEDIYYASFETERVKKAKSEKKTIKKTIKANQEVINSMNIPNAIETKVDDILIKQVEEALKINNDFQEQKALLDDFDKDTVLFDNVEDVLITKTPTNITEIPKIPFDEDLSEKERQEFVDDIFNDTFSLEDFLSDDLF